MITFTINRTWDGRPIDEPEISRLDARVDGGDLLLHVDAPFHGDPAPRQAVGRVDRLWEHEVVECFLVGPDDAYTEIELGPHGHYLVLRLHGRRNIIESAIEMEFVASIRADRWQGSARLATAHLPESLEKGNAFSIHGVGARRRYHAAHPVGGESPDFHRIAFFPTIAF